MAGNVPKSNNLSTKSSVIINIKDIVPDLNKPDTTDSISYFKKYINGIKKINELKNQKNVNISMFYIEPYEKDKYLAYIYHNNKDSYFIYDNKEINTKLYDIGNNNILSKITKLNKNLSKINNILNPKPISSESSKKSESSNKVFIEDIL
jgi:hypothetical protein